MTAADGLTERLVALTAPLPLDRRSSSSTGHRILDRAHLRFFTRRGMVRLIEGAGFEILRVRPVIWASGQKRLLNRLLGGALTDFLVGQYVFLARRSDHASGTRDASGPQDTMMRQLAICGISSARKCPDNRLAHR